MSINYTKPLPKDGGSNEAMQEFPAPYLAIQRFSSENAAVSSVVSLSDQTTAIEVAAVGGAAGIKWIPTTDTAGSIITAAGVTANYDHIIPPNTVRRFVVPRETIGTSSVSGANVANGLYQRVAYKSVGIGSVLTAEF